MTTINPYTSSYYSLLGNSQAQTTETTPAASTTADTPATTPSLSSAYSLDLSPQAQNYLNQSMATGSTNGSFVLSQADEQKISDILDKYKDAPFTQDTYNKILADLKEAGLAPDQLAAKDEVKTFNATQTLLDALNGKDTPITTPASAQEESQKKASNYVQGILQDWKSISTQVPAADDASAA